MADRVFQLQSYGHEPHAPKPFQYVIITPEPVEAKVVQAAWSYAVRYTAKGLDLPDHEAAAHLLHQRHPSWTIIESAVQSIGVKLALADQDTPETK
jgi:hypothetical protein